MLFRKRRATTPQAEAERRDAQRREATAEQERRRDAAAQAHREREAEEVRFETERARESSEAIKATCRAVGFWWPHGAPISASRLSARPTLAERVADTIREGWDAAREAARNLTQ